MYVDIEIEPPPTHGHQIFLDGGGTCESVVESGWWAYATFHKISLSKGSAISTSVSLFPGNGWVGKRIETLTPIGGGALSQNGRSFNHATTTNQFSKCHTEKSCFLFFHDIEIEPPPTHGHQIFLDGGGTCESVVESGWWAYATFHKISLSKGSAISTSLLTSAEPFAFITGHLAIVLHEDKVVAVECPPAGRTPAHEGRSHRNRQVLAHHLLSDASNSGR